MKKLIIVTLVVLTTLEFGYTQPVFGIRGGINLNDIVMDGAPALPKHLYENNIGFHISVLSQFSLFKQLSICPELQFIQKGANSGDNRINLNYLELPIIISFAPLKILSVEAGPSMAYLLSAKESPNDGTPDVSDVFDQPFDFGLTGGIKINATDKISIICRYYHGLNTIRSFPLTSPATNQTSVNQNFQFGMSYSFKK